MRVIRIEGTGFEAVDYADAVGPVVRSLPYSLRVLAENVVRQDSTGDLVRHVAGRDRGAVPFRPSRLILQDMLGLPLMVDVMAMRSAVTDAGGDPSQIDLTLPVDLVIDHAMTVNHWAEKFALTKNEAREFEINRERFAFLKACEARFPSLRVIPPGGGIMHQVNLEYLGRVVNATEAGSNLLAPDTNLGTDSHTTMINGLGILGWGIGGLEAEAIIFGESTSLNVPRVIGLEVSGSMPDEATATDLALTVAEKLRAVGVVDCFVEVFGSGYSGLSVADRATVANMSPEYGSTCVFCPTDANTIRFLKETGRTPEHAAMVEAYNRTQGLWVEKPDSAIDYDEVIHLDLGSIRRSVAGPSRPEQRIDLDKATGTLSLAGETGTARRVAVAGQDHDIGDGDVIIAAITSCTNTANPRNMVLAGLIARNAVNRGLAVKPHVKTSLSPGSRVVARYLEASGLQEPLDQLGFQITGFSCSTCNGMSGPLTPENDATIRENDIRAVAVLSGNRNFSGRIHPLASRNVLAAPPLVVAYALMGTILKDITSEPVGFDQDGTPVMLSDLWPSPDEVNAVLDAYLLPGDFQSVYQAIPTVSSHWNELEVNRDNYDWAPSTYVTFPPFLKGLSVQVQPVREMKQLRPIVILGDSVTTDHISPSGTITVDTEAAKFLMSRGVEQRDFNSFGTRRGSADVVIRSTFAGGRLVNEMAPGTEGSWTRLEPEGKIVSVYQAIETYKERGQELIVIGGREYGCGSSRDTAAKAPWLAGIRAVVVESFERIHRSNLVNMGIAPLCFPEGVSRKTLKLDGSELFDVDISDDLKTAGLTIHRKDGSAETIPLDLRLYNDAERETFRNGGLLPRAFRSFVGKAA